LMYGGAGYVGTGRGIVTERRHFIGAKGVTRKIEFNRGRHNLRIDKTTGEVLEGEVEGVAIGSRIIKVDDEPFFYSLIHTDRHPRLIEVREDGDCVITHDETQVTFSVPSATPDPNNDLGLYQDFAEMLMYPGARLLAMLLLLAVAGGLSIEHDVRWTLVWFVLSIILTICAWLFTPFLFNPDQFDFQHKPKNSHAPSVGLRSSYLFQDFLAWKDFFFKKDFKQLQWVDWYITKLLKPAKGIRVNPLLVFSLLFNLAAWFTVLFHKLHLLGIAYDFQATKMFWFYSTFSPPVLHVLVLFPLFELGPIGCGTRRWREVGQADGNLWKWALGLGFLDVVEGLLEMTSLIRIYWWKSVVGGLVLKYTWISLILLGFECLLRLKGGKNLERNARQDRMLTKLLLNNLPWRLHVPNGVSCQELFSNPTYAKRVRCAHWAVWWLLAHRMLRDILVSFLVGSILFLFTVGSCVRAWFCPYVSCCHLLIHRDPGHVTRDRRRMHRRQE